MEKKQYIKPVMIVMNIEPATMIAGSTDTLGVSDTGIENTDAILSRSGGSSIWDDEEE